MAIFEQDGNKCYFIHIPRTGGRYVSSLFENSYEVECKHHKINQEYIRGIDVTHLHYPLYIFHLGVQDIPHISVVRNPFNKVHSSLRNMHNIHGVDYNQLLEEKSSFINFINQELSYSSFHNNWFLPQYKFISPKTHIWKYEWGFGNKFKKWIFEKTKIKINISKTNYERFEGESDSPFILTKKSTKNIKDFYKKDYQTFGYNE